MAKVDITYETKYPGLGLKEFGFSVDGRGYKVTAKDGNSDLLDNFYRYIYVAKKSGANPFTYKKNNKSATQLFNIEPDKPSGIKEDTPKKIKTKPDSVQLDLFDSLKTAALIDKIADNLENLNKKDIAMRLDIIANTIDDRALNSVKATHFWDEISNNDVTPDIVIKVLNSFSEGSDNEEDISKGTNLNKDTIKTVLDAAEKFGIVEAINHGKWPQIKKGLTKN